MYQFAGHDTTSHTLAWTIYCVATHPDVEEKLTKELDAVFGPPTKGGPCADVTYDSLAKCEYLAAVLRESMRLYPVASDGMFRVADKDAVLPGGWLVKKGEILRIPLFAAFTGTGFPGSFSQPRVFLPERWLDGAPPPPQFLPFSAGARDCVGQSLALLAARVQLATLLHRFRFRRPDGAPPVRGRMVLTLVPEGGIHCIVEQRG